MNRLGIAAAIGLFLIAVSMVPAAEHAAAAVGVEEGNYWKYEAGADVEGMSVDVTMKMKVTGTEGSGASEVFVITMTGSGDVSGSTGGITMSGSVDISGKMKRLVSNFSLVSESLDMVMSVKASGISMKMTIGMEQTFDPALDDYIGDDNPGHGGTIVSRSTATTTASTKIEMSGFPAQTDSETSTDAVEQTIVIAASNESVTVPAGTFDCYKYTETLDMGGSSESLVYYYSDDVGNFVKQVGTSEAMGMFGNDELTSYSYGGKGGGTSSLLSGTNLLIIIVIIVAVLVVVALVVMMRGRGKAPAPMMPPPDMGAPPPPPPGA